jgi:hypothetical protein
MRSSLLLELVVDSRLMGGEKDMVFEASVGRVSSGVKYRAYSGNPTSEQLIHRPGFLREL